MKRTGSQGPLCSHRPTVINIFEAEEERRKEIIRKTAHSIAQIDMMLYYAKDEALDGIIEKLLNLTRVLVTQNIDKKKEQDFRAKVNPYRDTL